MPQRLWTPANLKTFLKHEDFYVRKWAQERFIQLYPEQAATPLMDMLDEKDSLTVSQALKTIGKYGELDEHGTPLRERLKQQTHPQTWTDIAKALALLGDYEALPLILQGMDSDSILDSPFCIITLCETLALFDTPETIARLGHHFTELMHESNFITSCASLYLKKAPYDELTKAVRQCLLSKSEPAFIHYGNPLAAATDIMIPVEQILNPLESEDFEEPLYTGFYWFTNTSPLSQETESHIKKHLRPPYRGLASLCLEMVNDTIKNRGDDLQFWVNQWRAGERPSGYRWRVVYGQIVLQEMAQLEQLNDKQAATALGILFQLLCDSDDQRRIDESTDRQQELVSILLEDRYQILPNIADEVAAFAEQYLPQLLNSLYVDEENWGRNRALQVLQKLAKRNKAMAFPAIPAVISTMLDKDYEGDMLDHASDVLRTIGSPAIPKIAEALPEANSTAEIYLAGTLGDIPYKESARVIMDFADDPTLADEWFLNALYGLASPESIPYLVQAFSFSDIIDTCKALYVTCKVNNLENPRREECEQMLNDYEENRCTSRRDMGLEETSSLNTVQNPPEQCSSEKNVEKPEEQQMQKASKNRPNKAKKKKKKKKK